MMTLRPYQQAAIDAIYQHLRDRDDNPCAVLPTGAGKTALLATLCHDAVTRWQGRVLVLAHVKELLEQTAGTLSRMAPDLRVGVYSAGLKRRDTDHPVIVAGIQSVFRRAAELDAFDLILVDEAHLIPPEGEGMYQTFLTDAKVVNPHVRVVGLTATPFRMTTGMICRPDHFLNHVCYEVGVRELIAGGYLCPLRTKAGTVKADMSSLHVRGGEFVAGEVEDLMDQETLVRAACAEIIQQTQDRTSVLIFASGVQHGQHLVDVLKREHGVECGFVSGDTPAAQREALIARFRRRGSDALFGDASPLKFLCNVNVLTTGFDAPNVDCVAMLRPTMSPGLYYQMCLDMETEVLTPKGWARHDEVQIGDTIGAFDMSDGNIVFCRAEDKVHRALASGEAMFGLDAPHLNIRVTDRHTMIYRGRSRSCVHWQKREAHDLASYADSFCIPVAGAGDGPDMPLSDDEIRFVGWMLTDGHRNPHNNTITISQSAASPHVPAIRKMLEGCGFGYREYRQARQGLQAGYPDGLTFVIPYGQPRGDNRHLRGWKHLADVVDGPLLNSLLGISKRQMRVLLDAMNLGDGSKQNTTRYRTRTLNLCIGSHKFLADQLQALCVLRGFRCNLSTYRQKTPWHQNEPVDQYILRVRDQQTATIGGARNRGNHLIPHRCRLGPVPFDPLEHVWCLSTRLGTLVTRRRGKVCVVGNCGRGFRLCEGKADCLVLDFGGNVLRHGPVDQVNVADPDGRGRGEAPAKECPECHALIHAAYGKCPECGYVFPPPDRTRHGAEASSVGILSDQQTDTRYMVHDTFYSVHTKRDAPPDAPKTLRVDYEVGFRQYKSEWVCLEHDGYAKQKAAAWWRARTDAPLPASVAEAVEWANAGALAPARAIVVRSKPKEYDRIVGYELSPKPTWEGGDLAGESSIPEPAFADDHIPF